MKKILAMMLAVLMIIGLMAGCNNNESTNTGPKDDITNTTPSDNTTEATDNTSGSTNDDENTDATGSIEDTTGNDELSEICKVLTEIVAAKPMQFPTMTMDVDIADEFAVKSYTGLESASDIEAAAFCEAAMGSQAYSIVLVKIKDTAKLNDVAQSMYDGIDTRKWICVEADDLKVAAAENYVILAMMDSEYAADCTAQNIIDAFATKYGELAVTIGD